MDIKYSKHMLELWELTGEIGALGETNEKYAIVYEKLSLALDAAENVGLITYHEIEENENETN